MPKIEAPLTALQKYIPAAAAPKMLAYLQHYAIHLTISRSRRSVLGDYRHATASQPHRISVNGDLNPYAFLITLIHEIAHLQTFVQHRHTVAPHGREWKNIYAQLLAQFLQEDIFPPDIIHALKKSLHDLPASSCADENLMRLLRKYDPQKNLVLVEHLAEGDYFKISQNRVFIRGKKLRKRYQCIEVATGKWYLFSAIYEVRKIDPPAVS